MDKQRKLDEIERLDSCHEEEDFAYTYRIRFIVEPSKEIIVIFFDAEAANGTDSCNNDQKEGGEKVLCVACFHWIGLEQLMFGLDRLLGEPCSVRRKNPNRSIPVCLRPKDGSGITMTVFLSAAMCQTFIDTVEEILDFLRDDDIVSMMIDTS